MKEHTPNEIKLISIEGHSPVPCVSHQAFISHDQVTINTDF